MCRMATKEEMTNMVFDLYEKNNVQYVCETVKEMTEDELKDIIADLYEV